MFKHCIKHCIKHASLSKNSLNLRFKKGHNVVTPWQRRWFYIADGKLWYYRAPHEGSLKHKDHQGDVHRTGGKHDMDKAAVIKVIEKFSFVQ